MKLYTFIIISIGVLFILYLGGVNTGTSKFMSSFGISNVSSISSDVSITSNASRTFDFTSGFWSTMLLILGAFVGLGLVSIVVGDAQSRGLTDIVYIGIAGALWGLIFRDFLDVWKIIANITGSTGWIYWTVNGIMLVYLGGFAFTLIEYIRGTD